MIIAITGAPCSGKTTVAKYLAKTLGINLVELNAFVMKKGIFSGYDSKRRCKIVDLGRLGREIKRMGGNVIIESHYSHLLDPDFVITLKCSPKDLIRRMRRRLWTKRKIEENIEAEIMEICKSEVVERGLKFYEIDVTGKSPKEIAGEIAKKLKEMLCLLKTDSDVTRL